jgi:hypothetical protein
MDLLRLQPTHLVEKKADVCARRHKTTERLSGRATLLFAAANMACLRSWVATRLALPAALQPSPC